MPQPLLLLAFFFAFLFPAHAQSRYVLKASGNYISKASVLIKPDGSAFGLDLGIRTKEQGLGIRNYDTFAYQKVRVVLNHEYVYTGPDIALGAIVSIPWSAFVKKDGSRCGKRDGSVETLLIYAENKGYAGTVLLEHEPRI